MNWNLFWGFYMLAFAVACLLVTYLVGYRSMTMIKRCNKKTTGTVIGHSAFRYNYVSLPVVEYEVDGKIYKVVGPKFKAGIKKTKITPFNKVVSETKYNIKSKEDLPDVAVLNVESNPFASVVINKSPMVDLYPVDSKVDVYYSSKRPKTAYVQRYVGYPKIFSFWVPLIIGILCVIGSLACFFGEPIIMQ